MKKTICLILAAIMILAVVPFAVFSENNDPDNSFTDVPDGKWYTNAVLFCRNNGYMTGVSADRFGTNDQITRAMLVTVLYKIAGGASDPNAVPVCDEPQNPFQDVPENKWYTSAVNWAYKNGLATGISNGTFAPNEYATREQIVTFLRKFAEKFLPNIDTDARASLEGYTDVKKKTYWATESLQWAVANGIISGRSNAILAPKDNATRAEFAQMIYKLIKQSDSAVDPATDGMSAFFEKMIRWYPGSASFGGRADTGIHVVFAYDAELLAEQFLDDYSIVYNNTTAAYYSEYGVWYVTSIRKNNPSEAAYGFIFSTDGKLLAFWEGIDLVPEINFDDEGVTRGPVSEFTDVTVPEPDGNVRTLVSVLYREHMVSSFRYYGEFNGAYAVRVDATALSVMTDEAVAGYWFHYNSSIKIEIIKDYERYTVKEAYFRGFITEYDVALLSFIHNSGKAVSAHT